MPKHPEYRNLTRLNIKNAICKISLAIILISAILIYLDMLRGLIIGR